MCIKIKIFHWSDILIYIFELYSKLFIIMNLKKVRIEPNRIESNQRTIRIRFGFDSNETNRKLGDSNSVRIRIRFDSIRTSLIRSEP